MNKLYGPYFAKNNLAIKSAPIIYEPGIHMSKIETIKILKNIEKELGEKIWTKN